MEHDIAKIIERAELAEARAEAAGRALDALERIISRTGGYMEPDDQAALRTARSVLEELGVRNRRPAPEWRGHVIKATPSVASDLARREIDARRALAAGGDKYTAAVARYTDGGRAEAAARIRELEGLGDRPHARAAWRMCSIEIIGLAPELLPIATTEIRNIFDTARDYSVAVADAQTYFLDRLGMESTVQWFGVGATTFRLRPR